MYIVFICIIISIHSLLKSVQFHQLQDFHNPTDGLHTMHGTWGICFQRQRSKYSARFAIVDHRYMAHMRCLWVDGYLRETFNQCEWVGIDEVPQTSLSIRPMDGQSLFENPCSYGPTASCCKGLFRMRSGPWKGRKS